jgi:hypothetical protein
MGMAISGSPLKNKEDTALLLGLNAEVSAPQISDDKKTPYSRKMAYYACSTAVSV